MSKHVKKPHWFRWQDAAITLGLGIVTGGLTIYAVLSPDTEGPPGWQWGMILVTAGFLGIWALVARDRAKWLSQFAWYPTYGFMISRENYVLPPEEEIDEAIRATVENLAEEEPRVREVLGEEAVFCWFKKDLNENTRNPARKKVKGVTIGYGWSMYVDYDSPGDPLGSTAFSHELKHILYGHATGNWDEATHHAVFR